MLDKIFKKLFGDKSQKDLQELLPIVDLINNEFSSLVSITDDELRLKTADFKSRIEKYNSETTAEIGSLRDNTQHPTTPIHEKEAIFKEIEQLEKKLDDQLEEVLMDILPEAFAVVKETARRLCDNGELSVTANAMDIELAVKYSCIYLHSSCIYHGN